MIIKITRVSVSKKGKIYIQAESIDGYIPRTETIFECEDVTTEEKEEDEGQARD